MLKNFIAAAVVLAITIAVVLVLPEGPVWTSRTIHLNCNGLALTGDLYIPREITSDTALLMLHGSTTRGRALRLYAALCEKLAERGFIALNLDQRGHNDSEGPAVIDDISDLDFVGDAREASRGLLKLLDNFPVDNVAMIGHSFGGGVVVAAGMDDKSTSKVISISPGRRIADRFLKEGRDREIRYVQKRKSHDMQREDLIPLELIKPMLETYTVERFSGQQLPKPLLFIEGSREDDEDLAFTVDLVASIKGPVEHVIIPKADHYFGTHKIGEGDEKRWAVVDSNIVERLVSEMDNWLRKDSY